MQQPPGAEQGKMRNFVAYSFACGSALQAATEGTYRRFLVTVPLPRARPLAVPSCARSAKWIFFLFPGGLTSKRTIGWSLLSSQGLSHYAVLRCSLQVQRLARRIKGHVIGAATRLSFGK